MARPVIRARYVEAFLLGFVISVLVGVVIAKWHFYRAAYAAPEPARSSAGS
ncbi:MAG: hypothetical protein JSR77_04425 [Planctomycetes bacterium]|nr:hypothetical protein [Planctomycetota bacterium]